MAKRADYFEHVAFRWVGRTSATNRFEVEIFGAVAKRAQAVVDEINDDDATRWWWRALAMRRQFFVGQGAKLAVLLRRWKSAEELKLHDPRNGATRGRCPGHDIDHIEPLCAGGPDVPGNMQWLTLEEHREKTRKDVYRCRMAAEARKP